MANLRLKKYNGSGYDTIHYETNSTLVLMDNGNTLEYEMYHHTHTKNKITNFPTSITPTSHTHTKSNITDFPSYIAPTAHTHSASNITANYIGIARGGFGRSTLTSGYFLLGNGTGAVQMKSVSEVKTLLGI